METILYLIILFLTLLGGYELFRRFKGLSIIGFILIPIILTPFWISNFYSTFLWFKMYSILLFLVLFLVLRYTYFSKNPLFLRLIYFMLVLNIAEAIIADFVYSNFFNGIAGILLILTLPTSIKKITVDTKNKKDLLYDIPFLWIFSYTLWNLVFIINIFPTAIFTNIVILGTAFIVGYFNRKTWLQARAYTLGIYLILLFTVPAISFYTMNSIPDAGFIYIMNIASFVWMIGYTFFYFYQIKNVKSVLEK